MPSTSAYKLRLLFTQHPYLVLEPPWGAGTWTRCALPHLWPCTTGASPNGDPPTSVSPWWGPGFSEQDLVGMRGGNLAWWQKGMAESTACGTCGCCGGSWLDGWRKLRKTMLCAYCPEELWSSPSVEMIPKTQLDMALGNLL